MMKVQVVESDDKVKDPKKEEARNESSTVIQSIFVADQELGKTKSKWL